MRRKNPIRCIFCRRAPAASSRSMGDGSVWAQFEWPWRERPLHPPSTVQPTGRVFPGRGETVLSSSLKFKSNSAPGNLPRASFAGGPPTALGRGVGETGTEEAVRCRCAGATKRPPPLCPPRSAVLPPRGAWGKTPSLPHPVVGPLWWALGALGAASPRSRRSEGRVAVFPLFAAACPVRRDWGGRGKGRGRDP